jgi:hypothetical protein
MGRVLIITLFVICASFGIGIFGTGFRENFMHRRNSIELVEKRKDEEEDQKI